jgi:acyl-CoA thioester hydrolase
VARVDGYTFSTDVRVRFAETDAQGIAHHANYLVWFEVARVEYFDRYAQSYARFQEDGYEATVVEVEVRYRAPARFDDRIRVWARCADVRGARMRFEYVLERLADGVRVAEGTTAHACVDAKTLRPTRLPAWLVDAVRSAESSSSSSSASSASAASSSRP